MRIHSAVQGASGRGVWWSSRSSYSPAVWRKLLTIYQRIARLYHERMHGLSLPAANAGAVRLGCGWRYLLVWPTAVPDIAYDVLFTYDDGGRDPGPCWQWLSAATGLTLARRWDAPEPMRLARDCPRPPGYETLARLEDFSV